MSSQNLPECAFCFFSIKNIITKIVALVVVYVLRYGTLIFIFHLSSWIFYSTRFGACVSHSAKSMVMGTLLGSSNIA